MHRGGRTDQQQAEPIGDVSNQGGEIAAIVMQKWRPVAYRSRSACGQGEEAPGAGGCVRAGGRPILVGIGAVGWAGSGGRVGHERCKNHIRRGCVKEYSFRAARATPNGHWVMGTDRAGGGDWAQGDPRVAAWTAWCAPRWWSRPDGRMAGAGRMRGHRADVRSWASFSRRPDYNSPHSRRVGQFESITKAMPVMGPPLAVNDTWAV